MIHYPSGCNILSSFQAVPPGIESRVLNLCAGSSEVVGPCGLEIDSMHFEADGCEGEEGRLFSQEKKKEVFFHVPPVSLVTSCACPLMLGGTSRPERVYLFPGT